MFDDLINCIAPTFSKNITSGQYIPTPPRQAKFNLLILKNVRLWLGTQTKATVSWWLFRSDRATVFG
jgi:hypothetical protein